MFISPALAHGTSTGGTSGGGIAFLVIIGVVVGLTLIFIGQKKWRARKIGHDVTSE